MFCDWAVNIGMDIRYRERELAGGPGVTHGHSTHRGTRAETSAVVNAGVYASAEEALNAALSVVEKAAAHDFEGTQEELADFLTEGLASRELSEEEFWHSVNSQTNAMLAASKNGPRG
jgi:hypothetical protein